MKIGLKSFNDRYCSTTDKDKVQNNNKIVLSNDIYALCECINDLKGALRWQSR